MLVAGGEGTRFGGRKQFVNLLGQPSLQHCITAAKTVTDDVILVVPKDLANEPVAGAQVVAGGATRSASVRAGLAMIAADAEIILIHDAARPAASAELFAAVVDAIENGADAAVPGIALADTIKVVQDGAKGRVVVSTPDRATLVAVHTPQGFKAPILFAAHASLAEATDDAALVEAMGATVQVIEGELGNLKITSPADLAFLEATLNAGAEHS
ncbi:MAG: 2-C-methyl-D-erythritol 4-phosphate cytidylyltransferase [Actinobacteria bacterium]|nr:2-C-methyl-D-erythritol 4-phosphate cytidylyltransferase [Actinomycetota bacterium]